MNTVKTGWRQTTTPHKGRFLADNKQQNNHTINNASRTLFNDRQGRHNTHSESNRQMVYSKWGGSKQHTVTSRWNGEEKGFNYIFVSGIEGSITFTNNIAQTEVSLTLVNWSREEWVVLPDVYQLIVSLSKHGPVYLVNAEGKGLQHGPHQVSSSGVRAQTQKTASCCCVIDRSLMRSEIKMEYLLFSTICGEKFSYKL